MEENINLTKNKCHELALKCKTKKEFYEKYKSAYKKAYANKWIDDICSHMIVFVRPIKSWTKEECHQEALKYIRKKEFRYNSKRIYNIARLNGWLDNICSHMLPSVSIFKRIIYLYEFSDNYVYIGLTHNPNKRHNQHFYEEKSPVYKHIVETSLIPKYIELTDYLDIETARQKEKYYINLFKENGYKLLNLREGGSLGSAIIKWNYNNCKLETNKYKTRSELRKNNIGAYRSALKNKWLNEFYGVINKTIWSYEKCKEIAINCKNKSEFRVNYCGAYYNSCKYGWINEFFPNIKQKNKWNYINCEKAVLNLKHKTRGEFYLQFPSAYAAALKKKWLNKLFPKKFAQ
jgi:predicted GIY-YIG superfamily endonuclease